MFKLIYPCTSLVTNHNKVIARLKLIMNALFNALYFRNEREEQLWLW